MGIGCAHAKTAWTLCASSHFSTDARSYSTRPCIRMYGGPARRRRQRFRGFGGAFQLGGELGSREPGCSGLELHKHLSGWCLQQYSSVTGVFHVSPFCDSISRFQTVIRFPTRPAVTLYFFDIASLNSLVLEYLRGCFFFHESHSSFIGS